MRVLLQGFGQMKVKSEDVPDSPADYTNSLSDDADGGLTSNGREHEVLPRGGGGGGDGGAPVLKKGPWTSAEDEVLKAYVKEHGPGNWNQVQRNSGLSRCGKSCRLRWTNHLRPDLKREPFSPDEKKLIMELHAKGGNKWAEMAALLPGRTDNEIKNYWNTRTKRLQRAGLPIYPENLLSQVSNEDQHSHIPGNGKKRLYDLSQGNDLDLDEVIFDNFNYEAQLSDISLCNLLGPNFVDPNYLSYPMNPPKRLAVSDSLMSGFDSSLSYEQFPHELENIPDSTDYDHIFFLNSGRINYLSVPFGSAIDGGDHQILNGNFSTSGPMPRPVKMELHSIQCTNNDPSNTWFDASSGSPIEQVDTFIQSPAASASVLSESFSPQNTVLLDALVHEGQGLGGHPKSQGSSKDSVPPVAYNQMLQHVQLNSSVEELRNNEVGYPVGYSSASVLAECAPGSSSFDEFQTSKSPSSLNTLLVAQKHHADTQLADGYRSFRPSPDALLESSLFYDDSEGSQDQSFDETLAALLHGDYFEEAYRHGLQQGLESLPWKNMPGACHTS